MTEPIQLSDLRRKTTLVDLGDDRLIEIRGLTAREICDHLDTHSILRTISIGGGMTPAEAIKGSPAALAAWVASACGHHRDPGAEQAVSDHMTIEQSSEIAEASLALTFSKGFGPFGGRLVALLGYVTTEAPGQGRVTRSPPPSPPVARPPTSAPGNSPPDNSPPKSSSTSDADSSAQPT